MRRPAVFLLVLSYAAFVSLGLPDTVLGVAWPTIRGIFGLSQAGMGAVLAAGMCGYVASGLLAGWLVARLGVGALLASSCGLVALALAGYAAAPAWALFVSWAVVNGLGSGAIDAALNGYAARHFAVRHLNWLHACWGLGATAGPLLMTAALVHAGSYRVGYRLLAAALASMGLAFASTRRSWDDETAPAADAAAPSPADAGSASAASFAKCRRGVRPRRPSSTSRRSCRSSRRPSRPCISSRPETGIWVTRRRSSG